MERTSEKLLEQISQAVQKGQAKTVWTLVQQAIDEGISPVTILNGGLVRGMSIIGEQLKNCDIFVPQVLLAARSMESGIRVLNPYLHAGGHMASGKVCIGTVRGDQHDIGKNLVRVMMESMGLTVIDLGTDVPPEQFVQTVEREKCSIVACSALLTTTMSEMGKVIHALEEAGVRERVRVMVGGVPVTEAFCQHIGADYFTTDAFEAAEVACRICRKRSTQHETDLPNS